MPRTADHEQRRRQIAAAVSQLISEDGLDAVTVARTAATAGMSVGLVQHYFRTKDEMLLHAFREISAHIRARVEARIRDGVAHRRPIARVMAEVMTEYIPLDQARRTEYRVARAFAGRALDAPALAEVDTETARKLREDIARAVHNGKECGEVEEDLDPLPAAVRLAAVMEGLALQVYREPEGAAGAAMARLVAPLLDDEIAAVFTGECRQYAGQAARP
ncbi:MULTISPECIES: TetR/AcrR family transcriptional regulator [Streptomyces]|uniref:TetR family transcriptional regulator n=1 Tax=Streptomyces amritsarensis TaxID=681158 RepID=A0ABX3G1C9_9ACTN|nr:MULTISPECIES: TetR/AcrR family transcriptional regulator [Streptomyces]MDX6763065.1 TetR/AcrR family transcriptional regulator [Streptomyces sp. F8]OLZ65452.1 TetR family transcriptional regulator [Streptomyces amritsarensis]